MGASIDDVCVFMRGNTTRAETSSPSFPVIFHSFCFGQRSGLVAAAAAGGVEAEENAGVGKGFGIANAVKKSDNERVQRRSARSCAVKGCCFLLLESIAKV
jgi:hypothetical protein